LSTFTQVGSTLEVAHALAKFDEVMGSGNTASIGVHAVNVTDALKRACTDELSEFAAQKAKSTEIL